MNYLLHIDTAVQTASVCLSDGPQPIGEKTNAAQRDHAAWLQVAVRDLCTESGLALSDLSAVAVSAGPGSYTGLRVGMSAAKGLCYALRIPLITVNTLQMMAAAARSLPEEGLLCPMIDARRLEVFAGLYHRSLEEIIKPQNYLLENGLFLPYLEKSRIIFFGNGSDKWQGIVTHKNAVFENVTATASAMLPLSWAAFEKRQFADLAYSEPFYGKEFYSPAPKRNL